MADRACEREDRLALEARELLFVDTNALTTRIFAMDYHGEATPGLTALAERAASRYDLVFLCGDDIPYDDTWDRSGDVHRATFQKRIAADLHARRIPYVPLRGTLEERAEHVTAVLRQFRKYRNPSRSGWARDFALIDRRAKRRTQNETSGWAGPSACFVCDQRL